MKYILLLMVLWWNFPIAYSQVDLSLSLELVNPNGKVDRSSYFLARLKNSDDSLSLFIGHTGKMGIASYDVQASFVRMYWKKKDGSVSHSSRHYFFDFGDKNHVLINPASEYLVKLPLFISPIDNYRGVLPPAKKVF